MLDQHALIQLIKAQAVALGRTPTRDEFDRENKGGRVSFLRSFGSYSAFVQASGLDPVFVSKAKFISNEVFTTSLPDHLERYEPRPTLDIKPYPKIASISDIHFPFPNQRVLNSFYDFCEENQPEYIFLNGDAWDMYSHTKFPRSHNVFTPKEEHETSRSMNEVFWKELIKRAPNAKKIQKMGNHDVRPLKRILESYPAAEDWIEKMLREAFTFDGVQTDFDPREETMLNDICIFHGYRSQLGAHRDYTLYNTINGHTHTGGTVFRRIRGQTLWELNSGLAGDPEAKGLTYTPQKIVHWTPGFGYVDQKGPRFIPV